MSAGTRSAVVHAISALVDAKLELATLDIRRHHAGDKEFLEYAVENRTADLDEALGDFEKNIKDQL